MKPNEITKEKKKNTQYIITHSQVKQIEENTAALQEIIENITQRIDEVKNNPNKIHDILEDVRKTGIDTINPK